MQGVFAPLAQVWQEIVSGHVDNQAPPLEELVDGLGIPPIQIEHPI